MKLEQKHITAALAVLNYDQLKPLSVANKAIEIAIAEASVPVPTDEFISADQARALGAGAEYYQPESERWITCEHLERFPASFHDGEVIKYRAIKQPKPVEPTCQVQLIGGEVQTMTREKAKALYEGNKTVCDWWLVASNGYVGELVRSTDVMNFTLDGVYTYRPKAKKVISWSSLPVGISVKDLTDECIGDFLWVQEDGLIFYSLSNEKDCYEVDPSKVRLAPASEQPWLNWRGGECPVPEGVIVEIGLRSGETEGNTGKADDYYWGNDKESSDIIEYRIVGIESGYVLGGN